MTDGFWTMIGVVAPVLIIQVFQFLSSWMANKKANVSREELKSSVAEVKDQIDTVKMHAEQVNLLVKGAERKGFEGGIEVGKQQSTGPTPLDDK